MHTLPERRGELVFRQENHTITPCEFFFSFCVCKPIITLGKHTSSHGSAPSEAALKHKVGKFEFVWRLFRASHYLICAFNDYCECKHQEFLRFGCLWQWLEGLRPTCNMGTQPPGGLVPREGILVNSGDRDGMQAVWRPSGMSATSHLVQSKSHY